MKTFSARRLFDVLWTGLRQEELNTIQDIGEKVWLTEKVVSSPFQSCESQRRIG